MTTPAMTDQDRERLAQARADGRAEAVMLIMGMCPDDALGDLTGYSHPVGPEDEGSAYWDEAKLRAAFKCDDKLFGMEARMEKAYWEYEEARMYLAYEAEQRLVAPPQQVVAVGSIDSPSLLQASVRLDEVQAMLREAGRWNGNDFDFNSKNPSEVALMDDTITDAISKLHAYIDARQAAPVFREPTNEERHAEGVAKLMASATTVPAIPGTAQQQAGAAPD